MISRTLYKVSAWVTTKSLREGDSFIEVCLYRFHCTTMFIHVAYIRLKWKNVTPCDRIVWNIEHLFSKHLLKWLFCWLTAQLYQGSIAMTEGKKENVGDTLSIFVLLNPLSPSIQMQTLQTDLNIFPTRIG